LAIEERGDGDFVAADGFADLGECCILSFFGGEEGACVVREVRE